MPVEIKVGTPLADALHNAVLPKLVEAGWSSGGEDDSSLAEYVVLMLVNGKTKEEIASELSNDLLGLGPDDPGAAQFAHWLFDQVDSLNAQLNGQAPVSAPAAEAEMAAVEEAVAEQQQQPDGGSGDADMGDASGSMSVVRAEYLRNLVLTRLCRPTGPKSMRNGPQQTRDKRMLGQINKNLRNPGDAALHRVRGANGAGRINSHNNRDPPKGPRSQQINRAMQMANGRPTGPPMGMQQGPMNFAQQQQMMSGMQGGPLNPEQQMQLLAMMEQQSQMMAQFMSGGPPGFGPGAQNGQGPNGKSLFDRVEDRPNRRNNRGFNRHQQNNANGKRPDGNSSMEVDNAEPADPENTICKFNLSCTRADCNFAHQSPAAPPGVNIDMSDSCTFGAACKNFKCTAKHPSPAKKFAHQAEIQCSFWPNCTKPNCPFKHPAPLCRNGGDCQVPDCKFTHNTTMCKFTPCKNPKCMFKHAEGQKGLFEDKVWTAEGMEGDHVSERKFVKEEGAEELIIPGVASDGQSGDAAVKQEEMQQPPIAA